jgi:hypothetical protein
VAVILIRQTPGITPSRAVEAILIPIVCPKDSKAMLANVIGDLRSQGQRWEPEFRGQHRGSTSSLSFTC